MVSRDVTSDTDNPYIDEIAAPRMSPVRYSLHYEDYSEQLMSRFGKMLQQQTLVDMTLMCSSHTLRVHKVVLAASSTYFKEVLSRAGGEPLVVLKMSFSVLKSLVEFMYCGRTTCAHDDLAELLSAAIFLSVRGLSRVTREGLGIQTDEELPQFPTPVVINRPPSTAAGTTPAVPLSAQDVTEESEPQPSTSQCRDPPVPTIAPTSAPPDHVNKLDAEWSLPTHCVRRHAGAGSDAGGTGYSELARLARTQRGRTGPRRGGWRRQMSCGGGDWRRGGGGVVPPSSNQELYRAQGRPPRRRHHHRMPGAQYARMHASSRNAQEYMEQMTLQAVDSIRPYSDNLMSLPPSEYYPQPPASSEAEVSSAVSQYVTALKNAGLPTDVPIVFETGDGSYVNVDEQVLLDMVQSNEMQYEVIERPVCLESSVDPAHVKSIDDLSRRLHQAGDHHAFSCDDVGGLSAILPDSAEPYSLPEPTPRTKERSVDFNEADLFGGEVLTDEVKKYYEEHFNLSLLPSESGLRKNDCFDFELPHGEFKGDSLDCLMSVDAPSGAADDAQERFDDLIKLNDEKRSVNAERPLLNDEQTVTDLRIPEIKIEVTRENGELVENAAESPEIKEIQPSDNTGNIEHEENLTSQADETVSKLEEIVQNSIENAGKSAIEPEISAEAIDAAGETETTDQMDGRAGAGETSNKVNLTEDFDEEDKENYEQSVGADTSDIPYAVGLRPRAQLRKRRQPKPRPALTELDVLMDTRCLRRKVRKKM